MIQEFSCRGCRDRVDILCWEMLGDGIVMGELSLIHRAEDGETADGLGDAACLVECVWIGWTGGVRDCVCDDVGRGEDRD